MKCSISLMSLLWVKSGGNPGERLCSSHVLKQVMMPSWRWVLRYRQVTFMIARVVLIGRLVDKDI